jgi:hypothetical protein
LSGVRAMLEERDFLLLCNRYRIDAFVSSMSRQMSDGLRCYIVKPNRAVDPSLIVESLESAPAELVSLCADADQYISRWMASFDG